MLSRRFGPFIQGATVCVMVRAVLEFALPDQVIDLLFDRFARTQYLRELLFSSLVGLMSQVVCGARRSVCEAYHQSDRDPGVSLTSVYNKLCGIEENVSAELVRCSASRIGEVIEKTGALHPPLLGNYSIRILDGNHLPSSEHRLAALRTTRSG